MRRMPYTVCAAIAAVLAGIVAGPAVAWQNTAYNQPPHLSFSP